LSESGFAGLDDFQDCGSEKTGVFDNFFIESAR
jgi:hypothetical protein